MEKVEENEVKVKNWGIEIPVDLKGTFKAVCALNKRTMTEVIVELMENYNDTHIQNQNRN